MDKISVNRRDRGLRKRPKTDSSGFLYTKTQEDYFAEMNGEVAIQVLGHAITVAVIILAFALIMIIITLVG